MLVHLLDTVKEANRVVQIQQWRCVQMQQWCFGQDWLKLIELEWSVLAQEPTQLPELKRSVESHMHFFRKVVRDFIFCKVQLYENVEKINGILLEVSSKVTVYNIGLNKPLTPTDLVEANHALVYLVQRQSFIVENYQIIIIRTDEFSQIKLLTI